MTNDHAKALSDCLARIFRSKDLKTSIKILYSFFLDHISLDFMTFVIYDAETNTVGHTVHAVGDSIVVVDDLIRFSDQSREEILDLLRLPRQAHYVPNGLKHPVVQQFHAQVGIKEPSSIIMLQVEMEPQRHAVLSLVVWEEDRYSSREIDLVEELSGQIKKAVRHIYSQLVIGRLREDVAAENRQMRKRGVLSSPDGTPGLEAVMARINRVAKLDTPVLLTGETGVGKELMANTIHARSRRSQGPLIGINCGAIAESLLDSELFGYEKGAFTGAVSRKIGFFEQADGGTIFLDEVSELSPMAQVKLLRVLQNHSFQRVGGEKAISADVRVIAASNRDLAEMVEHKEFRKDLWFRLSTFPINIPPLRERKGDIAELAEYFAWRHALDMKLPYRYRFAPEAMEQLKRYDWPGNVRELENVIEHALIMSNGAPLSFAHLGPAGLAEEPVLLGGTSGRPLTMNEMVARHIVHVLTVAGGRIEGEGGAAEILDMNPSTLRARMKKLGISLKKLPAT